MRILLQRVRTAQVTVEDRVTGAIGPGLLVFLGVAKADTEADAEYLLDKLAGLRIFQDPKGKMNLDIREAGGSLLIVSQFTLLADCRQGRRPSFDGAAGLEQANRLYEYFVTGARKRSLKVETGIFQASMQVNLVNDGPVTILCDSAERPKR